MPCIVDRCLGGNSCPVTLLAWCLASAILATPSRLEHCGLKSTVYDRRSIFPHPGGAGAGSPWWDRTVSQNGLCRSVQWPDAGTGAARVCRTGSGSGGFATGFPRAENEPDHGRRAAPRSGQSGLVCAGTGLGRGGCQNAVRQSGKGKRRAGRERGQRRWRAGLPCPEQGSGGKRYRSATGSFSGLVAPGWRCGAGGRAASAGVGPIHINGFATSAGFTSNTGFASNASFASTASLIHSADLASRTGADCCQYF